MATSIEDVIYRLRICAKVKNWTKLEFAARAGINESVLRRFWHEDWNPTVKTLRAMESAVPPRFKGKVPRVKPNER